MSCYESILNLLRLVHRSLHNAGPQYVLSLLHPYTPSRQLRSASLNLLSQQRITLAYCGFRHVIIRDNVGNQV